MSSADTAPQAALSVGRKSFLHCVFTTALEGGIQYWAEVGEYHWQIRGVDGKPITPRDDTDGFYATIRSNERDLEDPDDNGWGIDRVFQSTVLDPNAHGVTLVRPGFITPAGNTLRIDLDVVERGTKLFAQYCRGEINSNGIAVSEQQRKPLADDAYWRQFLAAEATHGQEGDYDAMVADNIVQFGLFGELVYG